MSDHELLHLLLSGGDRTGRAWEEFLRRYSNLFLSIVWQFERDRDEAMEKYLYVCTRLAADGCAILKKFQPEHAQRTPKLSTWLTVVVRNLCVEAYRSNHGRNRFPLALLRMSPFDRKVFEMYYWKGFSAEEILHTLSNGRAKTDVVESLKKIQFSLSRSPAQTKKKPQNIPYDDQDASMAVANPGSDAGQVEELFEESIKELTTQERAVIRLRFWEDLSAREIAQLLRISPVRRIYTLLGTAIGKLRARATQELHQ